MVVGNDSYSVINLVGKRLMLFVSLPWILSLEPFYNLI
jgi:hypothetical protein